MTPLLVASAILGVMLTHFHIALGVAFAVLGVLCLLSAGGLALTRRGVTPSSALRAREMGLVCVGLCMVVSASTTVLWKIFGP